VAAVLAVGLVLTGCCDSDRPPGAPPAATTSPIDEPTPPQHVHSAVDVGPELPVVALGWITANSQRVRVVLVEQNS